MMIDALDLDAQPRPIEFVCDTCLHSTISLDTKPPPRCPRCKVRMTPDDLDIPRDRFSTQRPQMTRRKAVGER
jgi:hypothetical protein